MLSGFGVLDPTTNSHRMAMTWWKSHHGHRGTSGACKWTVFRVALIGGIWGQNVDKHSGPVLHYSTLPKTLPNCEMAGQMYPGADLGF